MQTKQEKNGVRERHTASALGLILPPAPNWDASEAHPITQQLNAAPVLKASCSRRWPQTQNAAQGPTTASKPNQPEQKPAVIKSSKPLTQTLAGSKKYKKISSFLCSKASAPSFQTAVKPKP